MATLLRNITAYSNDAKTGHPNFQMKDSVKERWGKLTDSLARSRRLVESWS